MKLRKRIEITSMSLGNENNAICTPLRSSIAHRGHAVKVSYTNLTFPSSSLRGWLYSYGLFNATGTADNEDDEETDDAVDDDDDEDDAAAARIASCSRTAIVAAHGGHTRC
jgi:hypothetical protein